MPGDGVAVATTATGARPRARREKLHRVIGDREPVGAAASPSRREDVSECAESGCEVHSCA
ncbi:hypothetical protein BS78_10G093400 [Paspalum vaginatum]|nr:hypothetical protein BS78_10G093400 [Paspalum vaginatum]